MEEYECRNLDQNRLPIAGDAPKSSHQPDRSTHNAHVMAAMHDVIVTQMWVARDGQ